MYTVICIRLALAANELMDAVFIDSLCMCKKSYILKFISTKRLAERLVGRYNIQLLSVIFKMLSLRELEASAAFDVRPSKAMFVVIIK